MKIYYEGNLGDKRRDYCLSCDNNFSSICISCKTKSNGVPNKYCEIGSIPKKSNAEVLKAMSMDQLVEFLDTNGHHDAIWWKWFEETYCEKCPTETVYIDEHEDENIWKTECECAYCETHDNCRYFPDMDDVPGSKETIKLWLEAEVEDD